MVFSSTVFLMVFFPLVCGIYFLCPRGWRNGILLAASLLFYGWGEPKYILIMLFSTVFDYANGLAIGYFRARPRLASRQLSRRCSRPSATVLYCTMGPAMSWGKRVT